MDCQDYSTLQSERKRAQHLQREDRGAIQHLKCLGYSNRAIAREIGCTPTTIGNELRRGTAPRRSNKGRAPGYSAKRGHAVYSANRTRSHKPHKLNYCGAFAAWVVKQIREYHWSLDACVGYLPMSQQPIMIHTASADRLKEIMKSATEKGMAVSIYTHELFTTYNDEDNRSQIAMYETDNLNLVGIAIRGKKNSLDRITKGVNMHR